MSDNLLEVDNLPFFFTTFQNNESLEGRMYRVSPIITHENNLQNVIFTMIGRLKGFPLVLLADRPIKIALPPNLGLKNGSRITFVLCPPLKRAPFPHDFPPSELFKQHIGHMNGKFNLLSSC